MSNKLKRKVFIVANSSVKSLKTKIFVPTSSNEVRKYAKVVFLKSISLRSDFSTVVSSIS